MSGDSICLFLLLLHVSWGFNLSPSQVFSYEDNSDGYFGYSVALQRRRTGYWVIVGAPRANSSSDRSVHEPGVAYECGVETADCAPIELPHSTDQGNGNDKKLVFKQKEDNAWIGSAVDVDNNVDGRIVVCGHRCVNHLINSTVDPADEVYRMTGVCFVKDFTALNEDIQVLTPLNDRGKFTASIGPTSPGRSSTPVPRAHFYEFGQAGISAHFALNTTDLVIGAPGLLLGRGTMISYQPHSSSGGKEDVPWKGGKMFGFPLTPHPGKTPTLTDYGYFGYSVDSGALYQRNVTTYVGGAPRGASLKGKVFVFDFPEQRKSNYSEFKIFTEIEGTQLGEYFGASVCAVDLNHDGLADLVVGAPFYTLPLNYPGQSRSCEGRIYVFINSGQGIFTASKTNVLGSHINGRFGSAVSRIGDINKDGFNDVAVGAPYGHEHGRGAVYIYHGSATGLNPKPCQQISAVSVSPALSGFGISISRGLDVDSNGYDDIAVGAHSSGHVLLLTSRRIIVLNPDVEAVVSEGNSSRLQYLDQSSTQFVLSACVNYTGERQSGTVYVNIRLSADPRARFIDKDRQNRTYAFKVALKDNKPKCRQVLTKITNPKNYQIPLEMRMNFHLDLSKGAINSLGSCPTCPVVDPQAPDYTIFKLSYTPPKPTDLKIQAAFTEPRLVVVLGTRPRLQMEVTVTNNGASSASALVTVTLPPYTTLTAFLDDAWVERQNMSATSLEWAVLDLSAGESRVQGLWVELDTLGVTEGTQRLVFTFSASSAEMEENPHDNVAVISLPVRSEADLAVFAVSNQVHEKISASVTQNFSHTYTVKNFGPSLVSAVKLEFFLPTALRVAGTSVHVVDVLKPLPTLDSQPFQCTLVKGPEFKPSKADDADNSPTRRNVKRSIPTAVELDDVTLFPSTRTLKVNCSNADVVCQKVECLAGPFAPNTSSAIVSFRMEVNFKGIGSVMGERDILVISSTGRATLMESTKVSQPPEHWADVGTAITVFYGDRPPWWALDERIIYGSTAFGVLALLVIILICCKAGFFKRPQKEEMSAQKQAAKL